MMDSPELWPDDSPDAEALARAVPAACVHSARYIKERNPRLYKAVTLALSYAVPVSVLAKEVKISENTIRAIAFEEAQAVDDGKKELQRNLRKFAHGAAAVLAEQYDDIPVEKLGVPLGIAIDKLLLLDGQATQIVQHQHGASVEDVAARITAARERLAAGRVIEMGLAAENPPLTASEPHPMALVLTEELDLLEPGLGARGSGGEAPVQAT